MDQLKTRLFAGLGLWLLLMAPARADFIVVPNDSTTVEGSTGTVGMFRTGGTTFQWVLAANQFSAIPAGSQITSIGFRLDGGEFTQPPSAITFSEYIIQLGRPAQPFPSLSPTFANNLGPDTVQVRSGPLVLAASSLLGGPGPNPFLDIAFDVPYTYTGGDLLVTLRHPGAGPGIRVDAVTLPSSAGNTVAQTSFTATSGTVGYFYLPVTQFGFQAVPEPSTLTVLGFGTLGLLCHGWRRRKHATGVERLTTLGRTKRCT